MRKFKLLKDLPGIDAGTILVEKVAFPGTSDLFIDGHAKRRAGLTLRKEEEFGEALSIGGVHYATADVEEWLKEIEPEYKRWRAGEGKIYFYIEGHGMVSSDREFSHSMDGMYYKLGNYFQTEKEAETVANYLKALATVRDDAKGFTPDWSKSDEQSRWFVSFTHKSLPPRLTPIYDYNLDYQFYGIFGLPYFKTEEDARESIEKHQKEWETIFGIKDETESDDGR